jgi:hypothetical protein
MVYVTGKKRHVRVTLEEMPNGGILKRDLTTEGSGGQFYDSLLDMVMRNTFLDKTGQGDKRKSALVAVADQDNARVQILRFFWTNSDVCKPMFKHVFTVGGLRENYVELRKPVQVAYSATGELAICDQSLKQVYII